MKVKDIILRQQNNDKVAICYKNEKITYSQLYSSALLHCREIKKHFHNRNVGIFFHNSINYAIGYFSVALSDSVIIPIEDTINSDGMQSIVKYCEISLILTDTENLQILKKKIDLFPPLIHVYNIETQEFFEVGSGCEMEQGSEDEDDVIIMLHTSGTTSAPKRVMLTNKNIIANIESNIDSIGITEKDVCLIVLPMFFGYCNSSQFLSHLYMGAQLVIYDSTFIPKKFLSLIDEKKCTNTTCVPSMLFLVIRSCKREKYDLSTLRYLCFGGGMMPVDMLYKIMEFFNHTGMIQTYGQTEASPRVTALLPEQAVKKIGSVGKPIPNVHIDIVDEEDKSVKQGEIGEIVVKGPNVMKGYYKKRDITEKALRNGWLHTGDLGKMDEEGYLYIVGRIKNIIISGGLNIYPEEIEEVLVNYPPIKEAVVIAEHHDLLGEIPIAKVVLKDEGEVKSDDILQYCIKKLPSNKVPGRIIICSKLEKTYTGKIIRT